MLNKLRCLIAGHKYEVLTNVLCGDEYLGSIHACPRCGKVLFKKVNGFIRDRGHDVIYRDDLDKCQADHKAVTA